MVSASSVGQTQVVERGMLQRRWPRRVPWGVFVCEWLRKGERWCVHAYARYTCLGEADQVMRPATPRKLRSSLEYTCVCHGGWGFGVS